LEFFGKVKEQFLKFHFKDSLENVLKSFKFESLPKQAERELLEILQTLFEEEENRIEFFEQFFKIGEFYFEKQNYPNALRIFEGLMPFCLDKNVEKNLFYIFISSAYIGQIQHSKETAEKLLHLRYKMKYLKRGLELIEQIKSFNIGAELVQEYTIKFALLKKDIKTFNTVFDQLGLEYDSNDFYKYCIEVEANIQSESKDWMVAKNYLKLSTVYKLSELVNQNISDPIKRKEFVYLIYQYKIRYPTDLFIYPLLLEYAVFYERVKLEQVISSYFARNPNKFKKNTKVRDKILTLLNGPRLQFKEETDAIKRSANLKEPIRELNLKPKVDVKLDDFAAVSERVMIKAVELLDEGIFINYYKDLVACFAVMEFYQAALFILDKAGNILGKKLGIKDSLNLDYLRIDFFIKTGKYYEAIAMADDAVFYRPLDLKEKLGFLYLKAEALMMVGKHYKAEEIYKLIKEKFPNFRLVKGRLREIESLK